MLPRDTGNYLAFQFGGGPGAYWVMLALAAICVLINVAILNAPLGYYLRTIRDNEKAAQAIGVNILRYKIAGCRKKRGPGGVPGPTGVMRATLFHNPASVRS